MKRPSSHPLRVRALTLAAGLLALAAGLLAGCGGSSQSVISTGFPQGAGPFAVTAGGSSAGGSLSLTASNVQSAVFFPAPTAQADAGAPGCSADACMSSATNSRSLSLIPGTVYQLQNPTQPSGASYPNPTTLTIAYASAKGHDLNTLNIYYYDGKNWQPVTPSAGGFASNSGNITTTLTTVQGTGLYAVMSSAPPSNP